MKRRESIFTPVRVIPCLFEGEMPTFFGDVAPIDFRVGPVRAIEKLVSALRHNEADHARRTTVAKGVMTTLAVLGVGGAVFLSGGEDTRKENLRLILSKAYSTDLAACLKQAGFDVPPRKEERIAAIVEQMNPVQVLDDLFTVADLRAICPGLPRGGTKPQLIEWLLSAELVPN